MHHQTRPHGAHQPELDKRNTKIIRVSVDAVGDHSRCASDIKETQGFAPNYRISLGRARTPLLVPQIGLMFLP
jgi:hypothetical protein